MFDFSFLAQNRLWLLLGVFGLLIAYVLLQQRRRVYAARLASAELFDSIVPDRPGWRRHVSAAIFGLSLVSLITAFAKPATEVAVIRERATIVVAIDVSLSMEADDVDPTRLAAAQRAAIDFVEELPPTLNVGLVSFAGNANVLVSPTQDRVKLTRSIEGLKLAPSTAIGEAIFTSLDALLSAPVNDDGTLPPARVVLLSDGETTVGRSDSVATEAANRAGVPVSTIAFGTKDGIIEYDDPETEAVERELIPVPVGDDNLKAIAEATGGTFFEASSLEELEEVYSDIGSEVGSDTEFAEITDRFVGIGLLLLGLSAALSLLWFQRLP